MDFVRFPQLYVRWVGECLSESSNRIIHDEVVVQIKLSVRASRRKRPPSSHIGIRATSFGSAAQRHGSQEFASESEEKSLQLLPMTHIIQIRQMPSSELPPVRITYESGARTADSPNYAAKRRAGQAFYRLLSDGRIAAERAFNGGSPRTVVEIFFFVEKSIVRDHLAVFLSRIFYIGRWRLQHPPVAYLGNPS